MTDREALRLWAFQWIVNGVIRSLPQDVFLAVAPAGTTRIDGDGWTACELSEVVVEDGAVKRSCWIGWNKADHIVYVTPAIDVTTT